MTEKLSWQPDVPVRHDVDVFIAGGGPAGATAAVAAARAGASVFLAEGHSCLGGMGTAGMVPAFMQFGDGVHFLAAGLGREIYDRIFAMGGVGPADAKQEAPGSVCIRAEVLKRLYDDLLTEAGVDFTFHTQLIGVKVEQGRATHAICAAKSGLFAVKACIFIDGTGDGDLATWAGAAYEKGDENGAMMPGTLCSLWADVDWPTVKSKKTVRDGEYVMEAYEAGILTVPDRHLPGMWYVGEHIGGGNIGHAFGLDGTDERSLTEALIEQRRRLLEYERYYKKYLPGFADMTLAATGSLMGLRETRRIMGDYVLNVSDFEKRAVFADEIGRYCYPVDIHPSQPNAATYAQFEEEFRKRFRYKPGESYGIPYRCLTPRGLHNVLVAGRCVSTDRHVQGSIRVMPGCFITGQAAGVAAVLALNAGNDVRGFDVAELLKRLKAAGCYLPNA